MNSQYHPKTRHPLSIPPYGKDDAASTDEIVRQACSIAEVVNQALESAAGGVDPATRAWHLGIATTGLEHLLSMAEHYPFIVLQGLSEIQAQIGQLKAGVH